MVFINTLLFFAKKPKARGVGSRRAMQAIGMKPSKKGRPG